MKKLRDIILSKFFTLVFIILVAVALLFASEIIYLSIRNFNKKASEFSDRLLTAIEDDIYSDDVNLLKSALKSEVFSPLIHYKKYAWVVVTKNDVVIKTNLDGLKAGYLFSPELDKEEGFIFMNINRVTYIVAFASIGEKKVFAAIKPDKFREFVDSAIGNTYIVSPGGIVIVSNIKEYEGKAISSLGFDISKGDGSYKEKDKIFIFRSLDNGLGALVEYKTKELLANVMEQVTPLVIMLALSLFVIFVGISSLIKKIVISPVEELVKVIEKGEVRDFKTEVYEYKQIIDSLENLVFRFESTYNGLFLITSMNVDLEMEEKEVYEKILKDFEDFIPAMFPSKLISVVYYQFVEGKLVKFGERYYREESIEKIPLINNRIFESREDSFAPLFVDIGEEYKVLLIPLKVRNEFSYVVVLVLKGDLTRTESYAANVLSMEYQLMIDHAAHLYDLNRMATTDFLTGLKNRMYFMNRLAEECERKKRYESEKTFAVSMVDLNFLKKANDIYGHEAGDELIKTFADYIKDFARKSDVVGRLGGDEFGIIWLEIWPEDIKKIEKRFLEGLEKLYTPIRKIKVSAAIGSAVYGVDGTTPDVLLNTADERMYALKVKMKANRR